MDTTVIFAGNRMYIMMFDLTIINSTTATRPSEDTGLKQVEVMNNGGQNT